ncbi:uncharacterized protein N7511_009075 [Penicillium nucicola]|uniref:uncharacterized protein n=1 Tax=Penicillium nucicola TaxID=1850975 RepID=UPI0025451EB2|nr:uncharacterized protein N7511_009075 [Penicillium nucicola]KAJ5747379.1 hypothetical protein N7511_009075 [Penicillium nucicola]
MLSKGFSIALLVLQGLSTAAAQSYGPEKVWGVFTFTIFGDSTPEVLSNSRTLTTYGASELAAAAAAFRYRYISTAGSDASESGIQNISPSILDSKDVRVLSTAEQYVAASAQAFMQGLYPPVDMNTTDAQLANGSYAQAPVHGYQYPLIIPLGKSDPASFYVGGQADCEMHEAAEGEYRDSEEVDLIIRDTETFYVDLWHTALAGVFANEDSSTYTNAVPIADYIDYELVHNESFSQAIHDADILRARALADKFLYDTNSQQDSSHGSIIRNISPIAGRTLATSILESFDINIQMGGSQEKMTLLFGGDEPAIALSSLLGLASEHQPNFFSRLVRGGSFVFELYSFGEDEEYPTYPASDNLYVRFLLHNGTDATTQFQPYPMFGYSPSHSYIRYSEFRTELETFALSSIQEWCMMCNSNAIFCTGVMDAEKSKPEKKKTMAPAVAGVIGAVVALAIVGFVTAIGFLLCGIRKRRESRSSLGGFKGTDKMASDTDVVFRSPTWGNSKTQNSTQDISAGIVIQGNERLGSWEMGQQGKEVDHIERDGAVTSPFDDPDEDCGLHSLQPARVRESV